MLPLCGCFEPKKERRRCGEGDGERLGDIQDLRVNFLIEPETERRGRAGLAPATSSFPSSMKGLSSAASPEPMEKATVPPFGETGESRPPCLVAMGGAGAISSNWKSNGNACSTGNISSEKLYPLLSLRAGRMSAGGTVASDGGLPERCPADGGFWGTEDLICLSAVADVGALFLPTPFDIASQSASCFSSSLLQRMQGEK